MNMRLMHYVPRQFIDKARLIGRRNKDWTSQGWSLRLPIPGHVTWEDKHELRRQGVYMMQEPTLGFASDFRDDAEAVFLLLVRGVRK